MGFRKAQLALLALSAWTVAQDSGSSSEFPTEVVGCHYHGPTPFCFNADDMSEEWEIVTDVQEGELLDDYSGCHPHGQELHCTGDGAELSLMQEGGASEGDSLEGESHEGESHEGESHEGHDHEKGGSSSSGSSESASDISSGATSVEDAESMPGVSCHDHAGVPHCVDADGNTIELGCSAPSRDYDVPLRIGILFVILVTSTLGVFIPILTERFAKISTDHVIFIGLRQFGTGVIISTALVHLFTHAELYLSSDCISGITYEATTAAIVMGGIFLTFLIEFIAHRIFGSRSCDHGSSPTRSAEEGKHDHVVERAIVEDSNPKNLSLNTIIVEAGIIFHSILLGIVLVVASDGGFITLFIVILFHQIFEGMALGARIAIMPGSFLTKSLFGMGFGITTPIGMAIGIGVLSEFNGNDPATLIAMGTLNALSAGILLWIGLTEMWFKEWWYGPLRNAGPLKTCVGFAGLLAGLIVLSVIGKWA